VNIKKSQLFEPPNVYKIHAVVSNNFVHLNGRQ